MVWKLAFIFTLTLFSQEKEYRYYIEWKNISETTEYFLELKNPSNQILFKEKIKNNFYEFKLKAGTYSYRIAIANKFGKPSTFSNWEEIKIEKDSPKTTKLESKIKTYQYFVPGLVQFQLGKKNHSYFWWVWFTGLAITGNEFRVKGNEIANKNLNDPIFLALINWNTPIISDLYFLNQLNQAEKEYNTYQDRQKQISVLALFSYIFQVYQARKFHKESLEINISSWNKMNQFQVENYSQISLTWRF